MSEQKTENQPLAKANEKNGSNGKNGGPKNGTHLSESSIYFKVAVPKSIVKRDGRIVPFETDRIEKALERCFASLDIEPKTPVHDITIHGQRGGCQV